MIIDLSPETIKVDSGFFYAMRIQLMIQIDNYHENNSKLLIESNDIDLNVKNSEELRIIIYEKKYSILLQKLKSFFVYHKNKIRNNLFELMDSSTTIQFN